jgi:hypothetical protein
MFAVTDGAKRGLSDVSETFTERHCGTVRKESAHASAKLDHKWRPVGQHFV